MSLSTRRHLLTSATLFAALAAAHPASADDWSTPGLDAAHGRFSAERSGASFGDGRWIAAPTGARVLASPLVADGLMVVVDLEGEMRALRADDGGLAWRTSLAAPVQGTPAVVRGRIFVPTLGNRVVALRLADGMPVWKRDVGGMMMSSPAPVDGDIIMTVGVPGRSVIRLSGIDGAVIWQTPPVMEQFGNTSPVVGAGLVIVGATGGHYYAFNLATGALRWEYQADGIVHLAAPIVADGRVYMAGGGDSHHVHAVDAATGVAVAGWPIDLPTPDTDVAGTRVARQRAVSSFAFAGNLLLLGTRLDDAVDTTGDGQFDETLSRETIVALDPNTGALVWQQPLARAEITDPNQVPKFFAFPTPAAFASDGAPFVAVASSLEATVRVLDAATGLERARHTVAGPALASPVVANGRLHVVAMNGTAEALSSSANHPPAAAIPAAEPRPLDVGNVTLHWLPAVDPDAELPSYELRIDSDGELLESWDQQLMLPAGTTSAAITAALHPGSTYSFAVRARDGRGALSPWSASTTFTVIENPSVAVGGTPATSLAAALALARPGDIVTLAAGVYTLSQPLHLTAGVSLQGAGPGRTTLDATGLAIGVTIDATATGHSTALEGVTIKGAETCVQIAAGATSVRLGHFIARECHTDGVSIAAGAEAAVANATFVGNGVALRANGSARIKNSLLTGNTVGLGSDVTGALTSSFNDLFGNGANYRGLSAGTGDLSTEVAFADLAARDLRLTAPQASTDKGDPTDNVGDEPAPNGGRINLGAFGGTAEAETSAPSTSIIGGGTGGGAGPDPSSTSVPPPPSATPSGDDPANSGGCAFAGGPSNGWALLLVAAALAFARRRRRGAKPSAR